MTEKQYSKFVAGRLKPGRDVWYELSPSRANLLQLILGIAGEAGEIVDAVKKFTVYNQKLDRENFLEELGDMEFYLAGLRQAIGVTRKQVLDANISKLQKRYKNGYSDAAAERRADKIKC